MLLEVATAGGSFLGGVTAQLVAQSVLQKLFGFVAAAVAVIMLTRLQRRNVILDPDRRSRRPRRTVLRSTRAAAVVTYRVKRLPLAIVASFVAGNVSSLLGIGGGIIKVPVLNAWCGIPLRAAAATSAFMIGVTATAGATIYYGRGQLEPALAAAAVLGVQLGSWGGMRFGAARVGEVVEGADGGRAVHRLGDDVHEGRAMSADRGSDAGGAARACDRPRAPRRRDRQLARAWRPASCCR